MRFKTCILGESIIKTKYIIHRWRMKPYLKFHKDNLTRQSTNNISCTLQCSVMSFLLFLYSSQESLQLRFWGPGIMRMLNASDC